MTRRKRLLFHFMLFLPLSLGVLFLFVPQHDHVVANGARQVGRQDPADEILAPEQLVFLLQYLGTDYRGAVRAGQVVDGIEYQEMLEFSSTLIEHYRRLPGTAADSEILEQLKRTRRLIEEKADADQVRSLTRKILPRLTADLGVVAYPRLAPDLAKGRDLFSAVCSRCHGVRGDGKGPSAATMTPAPSSFRDARMNRISPHQVYNAVSFGVEGTEMPSHKESLSESARWDIAFYVMTLRRDFKPDLLESRPSPSLKELATRSNDELAAQWSGQGRGMGRGGIDHYRQNPPGPSPSDLLQLSIETLGQSFQAYRRGETGRALRLSLDAYLYGVEPVESSLVRKDSRLVSRLERRFALYRDALRSGATSETAGAELETLSKEIEEVRGGLDEAAPAWGVALIQSLTIILREGIEAALLLAIMVTYLVASGYRRLRKFVAAGAGAGVGAGLLTWLAAQFAMEVTPLGKEALEGITSLLAAGVLFTVSFWVIHQLDTRHWKSFIRNKAEAAMGSGSGTALAFAAFLAVYREAFETVLFYQALWLRGPSVGSAIVLGLAGGGLLLGLVVWLMFQFGLRIPLKQFFAVTGILLGLLALSFAGYGVRELQNIGWLKQTPLPWMISVPLFDIAPSLEGCALQLGILLSFLTGWFRTQRARRSLPTPLPSASL
ncbi:MAG: FTR1 family protein [Acidobacteriota bacterium]